MVAGGPGKAPGRGGAGDERRRARDKRRGDALRANLVRRKSQKRGRAAQNGEPDRDDDGEDGARDGNVGLDGGADGRG